MYVMARLQVLGRLALFVAIVWALQALVTRLTAGRGDDIATFLIIREGAFFGIVVLATWLMARIEHRPVADYGLPWRAMFRVQFWQGTLLGFAGGTLLVVLMHLSGVFALGPMALHGLDIEKWGIAWVLVFILVGLLEEYQFRGYALFALSKGIGFWPAAILSAAFFGYAHHDNTGEALIGLFNAGAFGLLQCYILRQSGNLWMPVGVHAAFDWSETYFYGVADSGQKAPGHLFESISPGPAWLSGGTVGPEGSVLATALIVIMWLACVAWFRRGQSGAARYYSKPWPNWKDESP